MHIYLCFCARLYKGPKNVHTIDMRVCFRLHLQRRGEPFGNYKLTETVWELLCINVISAKALEIQEDCSRPLRE